MDRMQVQQDLRRIAWEKDYDTVSEHLENLMNLLREFIALPRDSQILQLDTFRDAAIDALSRAEQR